MFTPCQVFVRDDSSPERNRLECTCSMRTMMNIRTLTVDPAGVVSGSRGGGRGTGMLSMVVKSLQDILTNSEDSSETLQEKVEKLDKQSSKKRNNMLAKVIPGDSENMENDNNRLENKNGLQKTDNSLDMSDGMSSADLRTISLDEMAWHDTPDDCWFAIYDYVYDCTSFIKNHPGGDDVLLEYAGRDATLAFTGAGHSKFAQKILERYLIGELPPDERIFRVAGGVKVFGL
ncbi:L-lactate dehydrogenase (cytochrome) isoform X1 [Athalia rosae]|uniref:L-lactate dehydrogenase (cytochrome) isoform X1 n=2 Tax=Athalia rosae TaxID=37344 RepID=UPI0020345E28|nr:L-lactate dehydrogenase (cytochrome) isoform X1 [Athalia rosae]